MPRKAGDTPVARPADLEVIEVLEQWNGPVAFLARYYQDIHGYPIPTLVYGHVQDESGLNRDDERTYDLWRLPPFTQADWEIRETELEYADGTS